MRSVNVLIDFTATSSLLTIINADEKSVEEVIQLERKVIRSARCNKAVEKYDNNQHWGGTLMVLIGQDKLYAFLCWFSKKGLQQKTLD